MWCLGPAILSLWAMVISYMVLFFGTKLHVELGVTVDAVEYAAWCCRVGAGVLLCLAVVGLVVENFRSAKRGL